MPYYESLTGIGLKNEKNITIVFDFGTAYTKAGFAGEYGPRVITKSEVKCRDTGKIVPVFDYKDQDQLRHHLVDFIHRLYFRNLLVNPKDRRVVVVEDLTGSSLIRNTIATVLFRHYEVLSVAFVPSHLVAVMTLGGRTGLVLDLGYQEARLIPVYEEVPVLEAWHALPLGAAAVHNSLSELLLDRAMTVCEDGKEQRLSTVMDNLPNNTLEDIIVRTGFASTLERSSRLQENKYDRSVEPPPPPPSVQYPLSGRNILTIPGTVREMAAEVLFERDLDQLSIATMILDALLKCPIDTRRSLAHNLVIIGGLASMKGLKHRILAEIRALVATQPYSNSLPSVEFKLHSPPAKDNYVGWLGGAILGATEAVVVRSIGREQFLNSDTLPEWCNLAYNVKEKESLEYKGL